MKYSFVRKFEKLLVWLFTVRTKVYAASWREGRQTTGQRLGFYSVMITPVKAKHFPTYRLVSSTLQNEHLSTLMDRQKQLLIEVLLESSWIFRLFLVEALRLFCFLFACLSFFFFFIFLFQVSACVPVAELGKTKANQSKPITCIFVKTTQSRFTLYYNLNDKLNVQGLCKDHTALWNV